MPHNLSEPGGYLRLVVTRVEDNPKHDPERARLYGQMTMNEPPTIERDVLRMDVDEAEFQVIRRAILTLMQRNIDAPQPE